MERNCTFFDANFVKFLQYTPFGEGIVSLLMPKIGREPNNLYLYSAIKNSTNSSNKGPVHKFYGHEDVVIEFAWRRPGYNRENHQLITWGRDSVLTLWPIGAHLKEMCGEDVEDEHPDDGSFPKGKFDNEPKRSSYNDVHQICTGAESENSSPKESLLVGTPHSSSFLGAASLENSKMNLASYYNLNSTHEHFPFQRVNFCYLEAFPKILVFRQ